MSKGSRRRPLQVSREQFDRNWEAAFGGKDEGGRMKEEGPEIPKSLNPEIPREQPDPVCHCGRTSTGRCPRCGEDMEKHAASGVANRQAASLAACSSPT